MLRYAESCEWALMYGSRPLLYLPVSPLPPPPHFAYFLRTGLLLSLLPGFLRGPASSVAPPPPTPNFYVDFLHWCPLYCFSPRVEKKLAFYILIKRKFASAQNQRSLWKSKFCSNLCLLRTLWKKWHTKHFVKKRKYEEMFISVHISHIFQNKWKFSKNR